jgi:hypothetical protein
MLARYTLGIEEGRAALDSVELAVNFYQFLNIMVKNMSRITVRHREIP